MHVKAVRELLGEIDTRGKGSKQEREKFNHSLYEKQTKKFSKHDFDYFKFALINK